MTEIKERGYGMPNNKPITLELLRAIVNETKDVSGDTVVKMMCDEEGNEIAKLWQVDVTKDGLVFWPADAELIY